MEGELSIFERPVSVPVELLRAARDRGWPDGLLQRAFNLRVTRYDVDQWFTHDEPVASIQELLDRREQLILGTLRVREAAWGDDEALADLYANSPEDVGKWEVTVERSPYPFAQLRLQEHGNMQVLEDRGVILAAAAQSGRNTVVDGKRLTAHIASSWRVRKECRGKGYSRLLGTMGGAALAWYGVLSYWYVRSGNFDAVDWIRAVRRDPATSDGPDETGRRGLPVTVHHFAAQPLEGDMADIRHARRSETRRCVALINRTHRGLDFFRPYSAEFLQTRLDDPSWGTKPGFWVPVYGWEDYHVLEEAGQIVACAGLWDCGRHMREVWRHKETGEQHLIDRTALMDFGYAEGRDDAMARLVGYLIGLTGALGRRYLMAALEFLPSVVDALSRYSPVAETRALHWEAEPELGGLKLTRPYTDLAYW